MLARIVQKEILEHLLSSRSMVASLLTVVTILVSVGLSATRYEQAIEQYSSNRIAHEREVVEGEMLGADLVYQVGDIFLEDRSHARDFHQEAGRGR